MTGFIVLGGPLADEHRVVHVVEADSEEAIRTTLARDPWSETHLRIESIELVDDPPRRSRSIGRGQVPNQRARRLAPKCCFSATSSSDGSWKRARRLRPREEVDVDAADASSAELDVAGAASVEARPAVAPPVRRATIDSATTRAARSENTPAFGTPTVATSPTAYTFGNRRLERARVDRDVAVLGHPALEHDIGCTMLGDAEEEVVRELRAVLEHCHPARRVERRDTVVRDERDVSLREGREQRRRGVR